MRSSPFLGILFLTFALSCLGGVLILSQTHLVSPAPSISKPNFADIENTDARKQAFFDLLAPMIFAKNEKIIATRTRLSTIQKKYTETGKLDRRSQNFLHLLEQQYLLTADELATEALIQRLLRRIDIVPVPLVLAQAASESGWGTSRFAQSANNYFGQWCYVEGCGLVPNQRNSGAIHEVAKFDSVSESISAYFFNLNTYYPYQDLRLKREKVREIGRRPRANDLIPALINYSERREAYLEDLRQIIRVNNLNRFAQTE